MGASSTKDKMTVEQITKTAVATALEFMEKERQRQQKGKRDRRLRNTKLLLRNYRKFKIHCEDNIHDLEELRDPDSLEYLDTDDLVIESIIRNKERTAVMLKYIDRMLQIYRILCEQSNKPEDLRRYRIMFDFYIVDEEKTVEEIAKCQNVDSRTVYRDVNKSCESLSSLIFGIDGIRLID